jgi:hypothetical protein
MSQQISNRKRRVVQRHLPQLRTYSLLTLVLLPAILLNGCGGGSGDTFHESHSNTAYPLSLPVRPGDRDEVYFSSNTAMKPGNNKTPGDI